jgi:hypothetical protein
VGARGRHHFSYATAFSCGSLKFREFLSLLKTPLLSAFTQIGHQTGRSGGFSSPICGRYQLDGHIFNRLSFSTHFVNKGKKRKGRGGYEPRCSLALRLSNLYPSSKTFESHPAQMHSAELPLYPQSVRLTPLPSSACRSWRQPTCRRRLILWFIRR